MSLTVVIDPRHAEHDHALRGDHTLQESLTAIKGFIGINDGAQRIQHLLDSLVEFGLSRVLFDHSLVDLVNIGHEFDLL